MNIDPEAIREHVEMLHTLAGDVDGQLVVASYGEDPATGAKIPNKVKRFDVGAIEPMVEEIIRLTQERHRNVYSPLHVVKRGLNGHQRGGKDDIEAVLGLVPDFDDHRAGEYRDRQPLQADMVLQTSQGRFQSFYLFPYPVSKDEAQPIAEGLQAHCGCDYGTKDIAHVWRIPGTLNWPNKKKADAGRPLDPQMVEVAEAWNGTMTTAADLAGAIKPPPEDASVDQHEQSKAGADDAGLIEKASKARNGAKFSQLYAGDWSGYDNQSAADQALCNMLAFWTGKDPGRMDRLFRSSRQMREKWDVVHASDGSTYGAMTIATAIGRCGETYTERNQPHGDADKVEELRPAEPINDEEWQTSRMAPDCIVENYLYADVAVQVGPGGTGKTTMNLREAIHIALGMPLYGLTVHKPGPVVVLTAEDSREMLVARLRCIAEAMGLSGAEVTEVCRLIRIHDVVGAGLRLTQVIGDMVRPSAFVDELIDSYTGIEPVLFMIDPAVSFGCGEGRVNDAEQGLVEAARRIRKGLNCCVRYTHHTGQGAARDKILDQYAGRGGSAFADGARMVHVLQPLDGNGWLKQAGEPLGHGDSGLILARPKMSYCPPQAPILLRRNGYHFDVVEAATRDPAEEAIQKARVVHDALVREYVAGRRHTQNSACTLEIGLSRNAIKDGIHWLIAQGEIVSRDVEEPVSRGARTYLYPVVVGTPTAHRAENQPKTDSPVCQ